MMPVDPETHLVAVTAHKAFSSRSSDRYDADQRIRYPELIEYLVLATGIVEKDLPLGWDGGR